MFADDDDDEIPEKFFDIKANMTDKRILYGMLKRLEIGGTLCSIVQHKNF